MPIERITDLDERAAALILDQFQDKPRIMAILGALADELQALEDAHDQILNETTIANAIGTQLDTIGKIVGEGRAGLDDDTYRARIRVRLFINRSNGRHAEFLKALEIFENNDTEGTFELREVFPAGLRLTQHDEPNTSTAEITILLRRMKGGGIRIDYVYDTVPREEAFVFSGLPIGVAIGDLGTIIGAADPAGAWSSRTSGTSGFLLGIAANADAIVIGGNGEIRYSVDNGDTYLPATGDTLPSFVFGLVSIGSAFLGVDGAGNVLGSEDGIAWQIWHAFGAQLLSIAWSGSIAVAVGAAGTVARIVGPIDLDAAPTISTESIGVAALFNGVAYGNGLFVAVGEGGRIYTSPTGLTGAWTLRASGTAVDLNGITYDSFSGVFLVVGNGGTVLRSTDGITYAAIASGTAQALFCVSGFLGAFVVGGNAGALRHSADAGLTFSGLTSGTANALRGVLLTDATGAEGLGMDHEDDPIYGGALAGVVKI